MCNILHLYLESNEEGFLLFGVLVSLGVNKEEEGCVCPVKGMYA